MFLQLAASLLYISVAWLVFLVRARWLRGRLERNSPQPRPRTVAFFHPYW
jgi:hypothetical protein